ncbi:MAG: cupredoxin family copper-binding protein [Chloroflexi bacterium]|nr:cupredoxin family copper-binding protein [Chloroflexota bacterium]
MKRLIITLLLGLSAMACGPSQLAGTTGTSQTAGPGTVVISSSVFNPLEITVKAGDAVTWINRDTVPHTITGGGWNSGNLTRGDQYSRKFDTTGPFDYVCAYHPGMKGKVTVK